MLLVCVSCGGESDGLGEPEGTVWRTEEVASQSAETAVLGAVWGVGPQRSGSEVYVMDGLAQEVVVVQESGAERIRFGGRGGGPAEFSQAREVLAVDGGVLVPDYEQRTVKRFGLNGDLLGTDPSIFSVPGPFDRFGADAEANLVGQVVGFGVETSGVDVLVRQTSGDPVSIDTIVTLPGTCCYREGGAQFLLHDRPLWDVGADGTLAYTSLLGQAIQVTNVHGRSPTEISRPRDLEALGLAEQSWARESLAAEMRRDRPDIPSEILDRMLASFEFGDYAPVIAELRVGDSGEIWVRRGRSLAEQREAVTRDQASVVDFGSDTWEVYSKEGEPLATVVFPSGFELVTLANGHAYGVRSSSLGEQRLEVRAIER